MRNIHEWHILDDDGVKREIRVKRQGLKWYFQTKRSDSTHWIYFDNKKKYPDIHDVEYFINILQKKYQRKRASHDDIELAKQLLIHIQSQSKISIRTKNSEINF